MSARTRQKAQRKYKLHLLSERESNQPSISTAKERDSFGNVEKSTQSVRWMWIHATWVPSAVCANDAYNTGQHYYRLDIRTKQ